jgi:hypothetical protein
MDLDQNARLTPQCRGLLLANMGLAMTAVLVFCVVPLSALAQSDDDAWQYRGTLYVYAPSISGKTTFPESGGGSSASVDGEDILNALEFAFMGAFEARRQDWGVFTDLIYLNLGAGASGSRDLTLGGEELPADAAAEIDYDLEGLAWSLTGEYQIASGSRTLDLLAGARLLDIESNLKWTITGDVGSVPVVDRAGDRRTTLQNVDAIVGCKGLIRFGSHQSWFVPYYLDVGTGESDLTWQAMAGLGYSFDWGDVLGALRYLDYDMASGSAIKELTFNGPAVAVSFRW